MNEQEDEYITALRRILQNEAEVSFSVCDTSENYFDLENSTDIAEVVKACEATDSPCIVISKGDNKLGYVIVLAGYGDESIADYGVNEFTEKYFGYDAYDAFTESYH